MKNIGRLPLKDINRYMKAICSLKPYGVDRISTTQVIYRLQRKYRRNNRYKKSEDIFHSFEILQSMGFIKLHKSHSDYPLIEITDSGMIFREQQAINKRNWIINNAIAILAFFVSIAALILGVA